MPVPSHIQTKLDNIRDARPVTPRGSVLSRPKPTFVQRAAAIGPNAPHKVQLYPRARTLMIRPPKGGIPPAPSYGDRLTPPAFCVRPGVGVRPSPQCHRSRPNALPADLVRHRDRKASALSPATPQFVRVFGVLVPLPPSS